MQVEQMGEEGGGAKYTVPLSEELWTEESLSQQQQWIPSFVTSLCLIWTMEQEPASSRCVIVL